MQANPHQGEEAATEPENGAGGGHDKNEGPPISDEDIQESTGRKSKKPEATSSTPAHRKGNLPKSILKRAVGDVSEASQAERGTSPSKSVSIHEDLEDKNGKLAKIFRGAAGRLRASGPVPEIELGVRIPRLVLNMDAGPVGSTTNSHGERTFVASGEGGSDSDSDGSGDESKMSRLCALLCACLYHLWAWPVSVSLFTIYMVYEWLFG